MLHPLRTFINIAIVVCDVFKNEDMKDDEENPNNQACYDKNNNTLTEH